MFTLPVRQLAIISALLLLTVANTIPVTAQSRSKFTLELVVQRTLEDLPVKVAPFGAIAVHPKGLIYLPNGVDAVRVLDLRLDDVRSIAITAPYAVAVSRAADRLYVGVRSPLAVETFTPDGQPIGHFWKQDGATLNALAVAPDDTVVVLWQTTNPPFTHFISSFDRNGKTLYTQEFAVTSRTTAVIHSITFNPDWSDPNGAMFVSFSGFAGDRAMITMRRFTQDGQEVSRRPIFFARNGLIPPGPLLRLRDGKLIALSQYGLSFYGTDGREILFATDVFRGAAPLAVPRGGAALAALPDGVAFVYAQATNRGLVILGIGRLIEAGFPTPTPLLPTWTPNTP